MKKIIILLLTFMPFINCFCQTSEEYYKRGIEKFNKKDFNGSILDLTEAIDLTLFETDDQSRKKILEKPETKKQVAGYFLQRGHAKYEINDFEGAEKDFWNVTMLLPDFTEGYFQMGKAYYELHMFELAKYAFDETLKLDSNDAEAYFRRGLSNYGLGNFKGAIADYTKALEIRCCPSEAFFHRGMAKTKLGDDSGALIDLTKAIVTNPNYALAYQERGFIKMRLQDLKGAIADYNISIRIYPDASSYRQRGLAKMILQDYYGAIDDCTESIKLDPTFPTAYMTRGMAKIRLNQKESGCLDLSKSGELGMTNAYEEIKKNCNK